MLRHAPGVDPAVERGYQKLKAGGVGVVIRLVPVVLENIVTLRPLMLREMVHVQPEPFAVLAGAVVRGETRFIESAVRVGFYAYFLPPFLYK